MASLEMVSIKMFECVPSDRSKKEKDLKVLIRDQSDNFRVLPVDDSRSKQDGKEVLECSSRSSVSETEDSLTFISSAETNSNPFYNLVETENTSRNEIIMGASSLVQIWEARSRPSSPTRNHFLLDSLFFESPIDEVRNNGEELDWCLQSNISDSCEKERESKCSPALVRIRGRQAFEDFSIMILRERKAYLEWISGLTTVSKFSPRGCERLQYMLRIRSFERCIAIRERHLFKSAKRSSSGSGVMNLSDRYKKNTGKPKIANEAIMSEDDINNKNNLKKHEIERKATEEGEGSGETTKNGIEMGSVETNNTLSIAEKVNLWDSKERTNMRKTMGEDKNEGKAARSSIEVEALEVIDMESTYGYGVSPQDFTSMISFEKRKGEENASSVSRESHTDEMSSKDMVGEDEHEDYSGESVNYDWVSPISRPRSYWDDLRKERELEIIKKHSKKDDIFQKLIKEKTVFSFLTSDFRKEIEKILISWPQKGLEMKGSHVDGEASEECSAENQGKLKESETENVDLESVVVCDGFSQDSAKSTMKTWSYEDHEPYLKDHNYTSSEAQMICDLREEVKKMQREMLELKGFVKSCVDFQKFKSDSVSDSLQRNCFVCFDKPIDSLLYRCGHMCTCLKCGHELLWSTKKCPICMAPIIDVVRAFLDS
ncbi:unnamed protein product [Eruca vesicaria subsp. sativa]|uniref:RING-type domain-containing protein n=1 Tax=Eruca vesicaria subsp. sativa TaxID=29727 RepID=A0ABC8IRR7_ERUVS|nr:unnamed protein product [Eruca vesicaria subsp. sativa]